MKNILQHSATSSTPNHKLNPLDSILEMRDNDYSDDEDDFYGVEVVVDDMDYILFEVIGRMKEYIRYYGLEMLDHYDDDLWSHVMTQLIQ
jgi:hypothetical protein